MIIYNLFYLTALSQFAICKFSIYSLAQNCIIIFTFSAASNPTNLVAHQKSDTSIGFSWTQSGMLTTGYVIYYWVTGTDNKLSVVISETANTRLQRHTHLLTALESGMNYSISIVAVADLPSDVVGPVTASMCSLIIIKGKK